MERVELSIIIPYYNCFEKLCRLLKSIGDKEGIQVIVVDDASNIDIAGELQKKYPHVEYHYQVKNGGAGKARNIGLNYAVGDWIMFADADDFFLPQYYEIVSNYFNEEFDIIFFAPISQYETSGMCAKRHIAFKNMIKKYIEDSNIHSENCIRYRFAVPWSKLIKRQMIVENHIEFSEILVANDQFFSAQCGYYAKKIKAVKDNVYCVTKSESSLTEKTDYETLMIRMKEYAKVYCFLVDKIGEYETRNIGIRFGFYVFFAIKNKYTVNQIFNVISFIKKERLPWV